MIDHILVPLDGSAMAASVLPTAQTIATLTGAQITLLTVIPSDAPDAAGQAARDSLDDAARRLREADLAVEERVEHGHAAEQIIQVARAHDLIAMATHARSDLGRLVVGSVADEVVRAASAPVLLVRPEAMVTVPPAPPRRILVPLDGSATAEQALPLAGWLAWRSGATLVLMQSTDMQRATERLFLHGLVIQATQQAARTAGDYLAQIAGRATLAEVPVQIDVRHEPPAEAIVACAVAGRVDLIIMSTHGRGGLGRWLLGSVADRVPRMTAVPVLLVRAQPSAEPVREVAGEREPAEAAISRRSQPVRVREIMTQPVVTVQEETTLEEVARTMLARRIGGVPVVDAQGRLRGMITEDDVAGTEGGLPFAAYRASHRLGPWMPARGLEAIYAHGRRLRARDIMTARVQTLSEDDAVAAAVETMLRHGTNHVPVVRDGVPVGMIARHDLLKLMTRGDEP